jgi:hypothetical protein
VIIELTWLLGAPAKWRKALALQDLPQNELVLDGPYTGTLHFGGPGSTAIRGALVRKIRLRRTEPVIELEIPSPVPGHEGVDVLELTLRYMPGENRWWSELPGDRWFEKSDLIKGPLNWWMEQLRPAIQLKTKANGLNKPRLGFPLERTGITEPFGWTYTNHHYLYAGVFVGKSGAHLLLVPTAETGPNEETCSGLRLAGLAETKLGGDTNHIAAPMFLAFPLSDLEPKSDTSIKKAFHMRPQGTWRAAVQWDPLKLGNKPKVSRLDARHVIELAWNLAVQHVLAGTKLQRSGQPVTALPRITVESDAVAQEIRPLLVFDLAEPSAKPQDAEATLRGIHLAHDKAIKIRAQFGWQPAGTAGAPWTTQQPWPLHDDALVVTGEIEQTSPLRWTDVPSQGDRATWAGRIDAIPGALESDPEVLASWSVKSGVVQREDGKVDEWLVWGSLEFKLRPETKALLNLKLRGNWTAGHGDVYPDSVLELVDCEVRTSATTDVAGRDLDAAFGVRDAAEDELQRESDPLRFPRSERGDVRKCDVRIAHRTYPGRNAVVRVEVRSNDQRSLGEESVFLQMRPFFVGVVQPADIDSEAGRLIASWASNDSEGAQWRVPDATVAVTLQPQAVGEAMERGVRFWAIDKAGTAVPRLDPNRPIFYRFSPPTQIIVRPSVRERRYNKSPSNLGAVFENAKIESFTTEMVYPVEARFEVSRHGLPDVRITETASMLGRPAENLEPLPGEDAEPGDKPLDRWMRLAFSGDAAVYAIAAKLQSADLAQLRSAHSAARSGFSARLAQFHLYDPWSAQGGLGLKEGLRFRIRDTKAGAPPLTNPLPQWKKLFGGAPTTLPADLTGSQKRDIHQPLGTHEFLSAAGDWGTGKESIPAGVVHTMEFASELVAVLRNPIASGGEIESLALSALGATGRMSVSFDEGRTTFIAETSFGQLSRLIKVRIGRLAVLWNRAKHIVVYERTTVASRQFEDEQEYDKTKPGKDLSLRGWPVLRKTEEYVEPIEPVRRFEYEEQKDVNRAGFLKASEFVTSRIYVNGAWGRDLGHGYEIPLWNPDDRSGFYPKPFIALQARASDDQISRCWHEEPHELYFYSNTERGTGADPDMWESKPDLDCARVLARMPLLNGAAVTKQEALASPGLPAPRLGATRRPRFDMAVRSDGKVDLQHGRGETHMLAALDIVSVARTAELSPADPSKFQGGAKVALKALQEASQAGARLESAAALRSQAEALIARATERLLRADGAKSECEAIKKDLKERIGSLFDNAKLQLGEALKKVSIPASVPEDALPFRKALAETQAQLLRHEDVLRAPFDKIRADLEAMRRAVQQGGGDVRNAAGKQLQAAHEIVSAVANSQKEQLEAFLNSLLDLDTGMQAKEKLVTVISNLETALTAAKVEFDKALPDFKNALVEVERAQAEVRKLSSHATVGGFARQLDAGLRMLLGFLAVDGQVANTWKHVEVEAKKAVEQAKAIVQRIGEAATELEKQATDLKNSLRDQVTGAIDKKLGDAEAALADMGLQLDAALSKALGLVNQVHDSVRMSTGQAQDDLIARWRSAVDTALGEKSNLRAKASTADAELKAFAEKSLELARKLVKAADDAGSWIDTLRDDCVGLVDLVDCSAAEEIASRLRNALSDAEAKLRERIAEQAGKLFDEQTRLQLAELQKEVGKATNDANKYTDQAGQAIKLVKAIGELPELPTLTFNADRAEYLFDDVKKQIETSPFAAKLREVDSGLKQLGIAVPARQLLDQIVPDSLKGLDFNKVFRNIGGLDFQDFFKRFQLPELKSENIKITQGVDKATRSAWVTTRVRADFREQQSLFEFSGLSVTLAEMKLRADSDMRVGVDGQRSSTTDALLLGDWGLHFGGASLAKFREVSVQFDGSAFKFDIEPSKIELHPALKFVDEFARRFSPDLPPAVELEKDSRGIPVGARATMVTEIKDLPPLGVVSIGPLRIVSGLGLRMSEGGQFVVKASVSVGTKTSPVWVQIGYLGGGMWLEAQATYQGSITYSAAVGLAIGSMKALNVASVARGSFALLLFAYAEIGNTGGSLRVGFSLSGSARILGIANASVLLLLEAEHGGGSTKGRGVLDVKIDICWCYTLKVRRDVDHKIS